MNEELDVNQSLDRKTRRRTFSLRILLVVFTLLACFFAFYSYRLHRLRQNNAAIAEIRNAGAEVFLANSKQTVMNNVEVGPVTMLSVLASYPPSSAVLVDLSDPTLAENDIRKLMPSLAMLIPSGMCEAGERYVALELSCNPNVSVDLIEEMRVRLPNCQFVKYTPVPNGTEKVIETGMSKKQVIKTVGTQIYNQRSEWPADKEPTITMLGSQLNNKYTSPNGLETWTYFTDEVGVGVLGIDFDLNQNVISVWRDRGVPASRDLTPEEPPQIIGL